MARPRGTRSPDFDARREELIARLADRLAAPDGHLAGIRTLAEAIGVTYPTLRHYFGSRDGILAALFEKRAAEGQVYLEMMARTDLPFAASVAEATRFLVGAAAQPQFMALHEIGLREGIKATGIGTHYLGKIFEPTLDAIERRLRHHVEAGEMRPADLRTAALALLSPVLLGALHQHSLEGAALRPLTMSAFGDEVAAMFVRAYGIAP